MNKQILFALLLIATTVAHGMKRQNPNIFLDNPNIFLDNDSNTKMVLFNRDLLWQVTTGLCSIPDPYKIKENIAALSTTNKFFRDFYDHTTLKQNIIRLCSEALKSNDKKIAQILLRRSAIAEKIQYFTDIALDANREFTAEDLKEEWYLTMRTNLWSDFLQKSMQQSLLQVALNNSLPAKVHKILDNTKELHFRYNRAENILYNMVEHRASANEFSRISFSDRIIFVTNNANLDDNLSIARRLITEKHILVDGRAENTQMTALMQATLRADKPFVRLLLECGASPKLEGENAYKHTKETAFDFEPTEGWLQAIIDEVEASKK